MLFSTALVALSFASAAAESLWSQEGIQHLLDDTERELTGSSPSSAPTTLVPQGECGLCDEGEYVAIINFEDMGIGNQTEICVGAGVELMGWEFSGTQPCFKVDAYSRTRDERGRFYTFNAESDGIPNNGQGCDDSADDDLCVDGQGLIGIIHGDVAPLPPDDDADGGEMFFYFDQGDWTTFFSRTYVVSSLVIDIDSPSEDTNPPVLISTSVGDIDTLLTRGPTTPMVEDNSVTTYYLDVRDATSTNLKKFVVDARQVSMGLGDVVMCVAPERCVGGIVSEDGTICCSGDCATCGGCDCALPPGPGADECCLGSIRFNNMACMTADDTGCLLDPDCPFVPIPPTGNCS